jgi:acetoacetate decarboxylase
MSNDRPRGGDILLSRTQPRGLPFLKPLYGLPPYQYTNNTVLIVVYEAAEDAIREVLPRELEPLPENNVAMCFFDCPDVSGIGSHNFAMACIPVRYREFVGQFVPYLYTSTDASLACYREGQGWPAVMGETEIRETQGRVTAILRRRGREVIRAHATMTGEQITALDFLPIILYKEIPTIDGRGCDAAYFLTSTSRLTNLNLRSGTAELAFVDSSDEPISRLNPIRVMQALYGTLDDFYPETIRELRQ